MRFILTIPLLLFIMILIQNQYCYAKQAQEKNILLEETINFNDIQEKPLGPFNLEQIVKFALENNPSMEVLDHSLAIASAGIDLARTNYLPRGSFLYQVNRASANNISGMTFPNDVIPPISGPAVSSPSSQNIWGTATGLLVSWDIFDFGLRRAKLDFSKTSYENEKLNKELSELELSVLVTKTYFNFLKSKYASRVFENNVQRMEKTLAFINKLVDAGLRPGIESSRIEAELSLARKELIQAQLNKRKINRILSLVMGVPNSEILTDDEVFLSNLDIEEEHNKELASHPMLKLQESSIDMISIKQKILKKSYLPTISIDTSVFGRGSGVNEMVQATGGADGLYPTRLNAGIGLSLNFPLFDWASIKVKRKIEGFNKELEITKYKVIQQKIISNFSSEKIAFESAKDLATESFIQLEFAQLNELQARKRFEAGLNTVLDLVDSQNLLFRAELDSMLAKTQIWEALFKMTSSKGSIQPFLQLIETQSKMIKDVN